MTIITTKLIVAPDGSISTADAVPPGEHEARIELHPADADSTPAQADLSWLKTFNVGSWPPGTTFGRDEIYGDDGR